MRVTLFAYVFSNFLLKPTTKPYYSIGFKLNTDNSLMELMPERDNQRKPRANQQLQKLSAKNFCLTTFPSLTRFLNAK
jgi:hypothetical protein